jgi:hypothetical protein
MAWDTPDVYDSPEKFGLKIIDQLDERDLSYMFNMVVAWKHEESGKVYVARDSGCSCPSPFEDCTSLDKLDEITKESFEELRKELLSEDEGFNIADVKGFLNEVEAALERTE